MEVEGHVQLSVEVGNDCDDNQEDRSKDQPSDNSRAFKLIIRAIGGGVGALWHGREWELITGDITTVYVSMILNK